eukprot:16432021-Heterocapsa_arctica.AAC.1
MVVVMTDAGLDEEQIRTQIANLRAEKRSGRVAALLAGCARVCLDAESEPLLLLKSLNACYSLV